MFEASASERTKASPAGVWALWADPERWPEWNDQLESAELDEDPGGDSGLRVGARVRVKFKRGGRMAFSIVALDPERLFVDEARFPGARFGHEHRIEPAAEGGCTITHRLYVKGFASRFWAPMLGRKRLRESVAEFGAREREIAEREERIA